MAGENAEQRNGLFESIFHHAAVHTLRHAMWRCTYTDAFLRRNCIDSAPTSISGTSDDDALLIRIRTFQRVLQTVHLCPSVPTESQTDRRAVITPRSVCNGSSGSVLI